MQRYLVWKTGPGPLSVECRRLGEAALRPNLQILSPSGPLALRREDEADIARFLLDGPQVDCLLSSPTALRPPCLIFQCDAFLASSALRRTWGWSIRISREGQAFAAEHLGGRPVSLRRDGFTRASVRQVPDLARIASDHVIIGLA